MAAPVAASASDCPLPKGRVVLPLRCCQPARVVILLPVVIALEAVHAEDRGTIALAAQPVPSSSRPATSIAPSLSTDAAYALRVPAIETSSRPPLDLNAEPWRRSARLIGLLPANRSATNGDLTSICLYSDPQSLWLAMRCDGRSGNALRQQASTRDDKVWRDDSIEIKLRPSDDASHLFHVIVNSAGAVYDARNGDATWNGNLQIQASTDARGWTTIIGIPFATLSVTNPAPGTTWKANFFRNIPAKTAEIPQSSANSARQCWCPPWVIDGGVQEFGAITFAAPGEAPLRFRSSPAFVIGDNALALDPLPGLQLDATGLDARGAPIVQSHPVVAPDGACKLVLADDRVRRVRISILNASGHVLSRGVYPMLSPEIRARIESLSHELRAIRRELPRFSPHAAALARSVLNEIERPLADAIRTVAEPHTASPQEWDRLSEKAAAWSMKLDAPANLARTLEKLPEAKFGLGWESPMRKVMIRDVPFAGTFDDRYDLSLARNEHEGCQLVVMPFAENLRNVSVTASPLRAGDSRPAPGATLTISLVGHVKVEGKQPYDVERNGWYPDPLLSFQSHCDVSAGEHVAFWIDVATSRTTPAGAYTSALTVSADNHKPVALKLNVQVWNFTLADGTHLRNAFAYDEASVGRFYGARWNREMRYRYYDFLLDHRLNVDNIYRRERPTLEVIQHGIERGMNAFNVGSEFLGRESKPESRRAKDEYIDELRRRDLLPHAYVYGFDEVKESRFVEVREAFDRVHQAFPGLKTMTTAQDHSFGAKSGLHDAVDIWVPTTDQYDLAEARRLRAAGKEMWWYVCVVPIHPYANWFVEYPAIEARLLTGAMSFKYQTDGFLYYLLNLWSQNKAVVGPGPYTNWNPASFIKDDTGEVSYGDGSLFCPGPDGPLSTIRMENLRDGFEDYEYLWTLRDLVRQLRDRPATPKINRFFARAEALLAVPDRVVRSVVDFTPDPQELTAYRTELVETIAEGLALTR